jgi:hypothetical protein
VLIKLNAFTQLSDIHCGILYTSKLVNFVVLRDLQNIAKATELFSKGVKPNLVLPPIPVDAVGNHFLHTNLRHM